MPRIGDRQLDLVYRRMASEHNLTPDHKIDSSNMVKLLATVADRWDRNAQGLELDLARTGITRDEQLELVRRGMDSGEKADLITILDEGTLPMTAEVRRFLEQVVGREVVVPEDGALRVTGSSGQIKGTGKSGATVEAINLSTAPDKRLHPDDTFQMATVGSDGRFTGRVPDMQQGDIIRLRQREADGTVGNWLTVVCGGTGRDTRPAQTALHRVGLDDIGDGKVKLVNINPSRPISEPGAQVRFVNERTGESATFTMNDEGTFGGAMELPGRKGDVFSVRATDGTNNTDYSVEAGKVTVPGGDDEQHDIDLPDPEMHPDECSAEGVPKYKLKRFSGPLFTDGVAPADVRQGAIGNCYLPSAVAAIADSQPDAIQRAIKDNGDGTFTVTFHKKDWRSGEYRPEEVTVDGDLYVRSYGGPIYGCSTGSTDPDKMELWWPVLEKAYAQWKGGYDDIGNGGSSSRVFSEILGKDADDTRMNGNPDEVWRKLKASVDAKRPVSAGTYSKSESERYTNSGVYANHSYSVVGYDESGGERKVDMRNPWGQSEPYPGDGKNDGFFKLTMDKFMHLYQTLYTIRP